MFEATALSLQIRKDICGTCSSNVRVLNDETASEKDKMHAAEYFASKENLEIDDDIREYLKNITKSIRIREMYRAKGSAFQECPNCGEIIGADASVCPYCRYNFTTKTVESDEEYQERTKREREAKEAEYNRQSEMQALARETRSKNTKYEYDVVTVNDKSNGTVDVVALKTVLAKYASERWRLVNMISNEVGRNSSTGGYGGLSLGTNSTIDQTVLVFERIVEEGI